MNHEQAEPDALGLLAADKARVAPEVSAAETAALVAGNSAFAFDLFRTVGGQAGNLFCSPYSVSAALAMTYAGARQATEAQMARALRFTLPQQRLHPAFNGLEQMLAARGEGARGKDGQGFRLNVVNALWGQTGYAFLEPFLDTLAEQYGAGLRLLDFARAPEASRLAINRWVSAQTEERINDLVPPGLIDPLTRLVLTNAIYFNAAWAYPFTEDRTADGPFFLLDGGEVTAPLMRQTETLAYAAGAGYQAVELPYDGRELAMLILLPALGSFADFERDLDAARVERIVGALARRRVALTLPRFKFEAAFGLKQALQALGMRDAFDDAADFSGIEPQRELFIADVVHKAFVAVDEAGTEAAAATAVVMMTRAMMPQEPLEMRVDRPFLFLIRDVKSGAILFVGRVADPAA